MFTTADAKSHAIQFSLEFPIEEAELLLQILNKKNIHCHNKAEVILNCAKQNNLELMKVILQEGIFNGWDKQHDADHNYAIHWAVKNHNFLMVQTLLDHVCVLISCKICKTFKLSGENAFLSACTLRAASIGN